MRAVNFNYLKETHGLLKDDGTILSNKRLRRLAYLDVHQSHYQSYGLYNDYKRIVNSEAANNQLMVLLIVIGLMTGTFLFFVT